MTDARISLIRDAFLRVHGLYLPDSEIRELLAALDKVGPPLPAAANLELDSLETSEREAAPFRLNLPEVA